MVVRIQQGDLAAIPADVIINAANTELKHGGGVAAALARVAGPALTRESRRAGFVPLGRFAVTGAGHLPARFVLHIPTIDYRAGGRVITLPQLREVWREVLWWCARRKLNRVAVPLLGAGVAGLPAEKVEKLLREEAERFPQLEVVIVKRRPWKHKRPAGR
jgi:O-acetyl-ADP-ribose deacetylase (regulator of RNase III)